MSEENPFGEVIHSYTRAEAIEDGVLVDVSARAAEAGFKWPAAVTQAMWASYVSPTEAEASEGQCEGGRLWDILWMLRHAIARGQNGPQVLFEVVIRKEAGCRWRSNEKPLDEPGCDGDRMRVVTLKAIAGPGDECAPVLTIMLPEED